MRSVLFMLRISLSQPQHLGCGEGPLGEPEALEGKGQLEELRGAQAPRPPLLSVLRAEWVG